jgi:hypothetical protein
MRGSSDLDGYWESAIRLKKEGGRLTLEAEHREAEAGETVVIRRDSDAVTRSLRFRVAEGTTHARSPPTSSTIPMRPRIRWRRQSAQTSKPC